MVLKVVQVIPKLGYGGAETGCYDLAHYLPEKGCKSYIITSSGQLLNFVKKKKVKVFRLPVNSKNPLIILFNAVIISLIVLIYNIDIVHARSRAPAWSCLWACFITRRKFVTTFHGTYNFSNSFKKFYNSVMVKSELLIAGSNFIFNHIVENYNNHLDKKKKLLVIFRGINLDFYNKRNISNNKKNKIINEWKVDISKFIILLPGRLTKWKGQEVIIEALNVLKKNYNKYDFQAIILGSNQGRTVYSKKLINLVDRHQLNKNVIFIEHCQEMPLAYDLANVVISSSIEPEAFGRVSVETQAMQKPIIASDLGGSQETVINEKTGFLFKPGDPQELAKVINKVMELSKEALYSMGNEGRKNVIKKFDVEKMCQTTFNEYQKLFK